MMESNSEVQLSGDETAPQSRKTFVDYVSVLVVWKNFILVNVVAVTLIVIGISFLFPNWYKASSSILPPKDQGLLNLLGNPTSMLKGLSSLQRLSGGIPQTNTYNYFAILKSRSVLDSVIRHFDLVQVYGFSDGSVEKTRKALLENAAFEYQDDDYITIDVFDRDPQRAASMANYFVELLNETSIKLGTQEARNNREFIEDRLTQTKADLRTAEEALTRFQEKSGVVITPEQNASVTALAELYAIKAKKEVELAVLERSVTQDNQMAQQIRMELQELDKKLSTIPQVGIETFRLYRDVTIEQKILEVLVPLYEQAKIDEQKNVPVLLVLDKAVPPERKTKPQRSLIVFLAGTLSVFLFVLLAFLFHGLARRERELRPLERTLHIYAQRIAARYKIHLT